MFGAPDRRPGFSYRQPARRRAGVGDHVRLCGGYLGLIVDIEPGGLCIIAKRSRDGRTVIESPGPILVDQLEIMQITPLALNEVVDRTWRRGALG